MSFTIFLQDNVLSIFKRKYLTLIVGWMVYPLHRAENCLAFLEFLFSQTTYSLFRRCRDNLLSVGQPEQDSRTLNSFSDCDLLEGSV